MTMLLVLVLAAGLASPAHAQEQLTFGSRHDGAIAPGASRGFTFAASSGDEISGQAELLGTEGNLQFLDAAGNRLPQLKVRQWYLGGTVGRRVGFVAPSSGSYQVRVTATGTRAGTYSLQLAKRTIEARMQGVTVTPTIVARSPRIEQLTRESQASGRVAVDRFWQEVAGQGPIIEPIPANDQDVLVTFLWRATYETRNVLVGWPMAAWRAADYYMSHLPGTDVWYKTIQLQRGSRFTYGLSPNLRAETDRIIAEQLDPLNPRLFPGDPAAPVDGSSVLETPGAPDDSWARRVPSVRGRLEEQRFASALLKNERGISTYLPPGYSPASGPYPLIVVFDGPAYTRPAFIDATTTLDNLINDRRIRPAIVCFVESLNRLVDLGFGDAYGNAIVLELLPQLRKTYAISTRAQDTVIGGYSAGGLAASLIALRHSDVFGNVFSQSGAFRARTTTDHEPNSIARMYAASQRRPVRFYLEAGIYENVPSAGLPLHEMALDEGITASNRHFRDVLVSKGYDVTYRETATSHEFVHWRATFADAVIALLKSK